MTPRTQARTAVSWHAMWFTKVQVICSLLRNSYFVPQSRNAGGWCVWLHPSMGTHATSGKHQWNVAPTSASLNQDLCSLTCCILLQAACGRAIILRVATFSQGFEGSFGSKNWQLWEKNSQRNTLGELHMVGQMHIWPLQSTSGYKLNQNKQSCGQSDSTQ